MDKIIQAEVDKLMEAGHIEEIQFSECLSNVFLVLKPGGKWRMCIDFRFLNEACPKDFYPLLRINQLVDSTFGCELLSMMDTSQGYDQIMLALEDCKRVSFITSAGLPLLVKPSQGDTSERSVGRLGNALVEVAPKHQPYKERPHGTEKYETLIPLLQGIKAEKLTIVSGEGVSRRRGRGVCVLYTTHYV
ncbi:UNVERIFIED_CONTAM: hypothetical protein Sangu_2835400 [Sesamum angustifolium]|uniref:Transposon Ty3-I Gag-Pol polyprotein n=2 Tax=Sesamum angustifolium TaxID=2727405 RepID=A0AAW2IQH8_9LAMI